MKKSGLKTIGILSAYLFILISFCLSYGQLAECKIDFIVDSTYMPMRVNDYSTYIKSELDDKFINVVESSRKKVSVNVIRKNQLIQFVVQYQLYLKNVKLSFIESSLSTLPDDLVDKFSLKVISRGQAKCVDTLKRSELTISIILITLLFLMFFSRKKID